MENKEILKKLDDDKHYYGEFGKQFLSNSDISALLNNDPLQFKSFSAQKVAFVHGSYFHTFILEPHKVKNFNIIDMPNRRTKAYKEIANGDILLLRHEADKIEAMAQEVLMDDICYDLIREGNVEYEVPGTGLINGLPWKGKADIINHTTKRVVDLKTTRALYGFHDSIYNYNYDSQAYVYEKLFGYRLCFIAVDKRDHAFEVVETTDEQIESGRDKVERASEIYKQWFPHNDYSWLNQLKSTSEV